MTNSKFRLIDEISISRLSYQFVSAFENSMIRIRYKTNIRRFTTIRRSLLQLVRFPRLFYDEMRDEIRTDNRKIAI